MGSTYTRHKNKNVYKFSVEGRAINLELFPFQIKNQLVSVNEDYHGQNEEYNDKSLNLIRVESIDLKRIFGRILISEMVFIPCFLFFDPLKRIYHKILRLIKRI